MGHAKDTLELSDNHPDAAGPGRWGWLNRWLNGWLDEIRARLSRRIPTPSPQPSGDAPPNPILRTATPLLALMLRLPELPPPANPDGLRQRIIAALRRFPSAARAAGIGPDPMRAAHFILCAALDDVICQTGWGRHGRWLERSLTRTFYPSLEPGPSLVTLLEHILTVPDPATATAPWPNPHLDVLELVSVCLALGFDGRTALKGTVDIQLLRDNVHLAILDTRGEPASGLSPYWQGVPAPRPPLSALVPVWVTLTLAGALLTGLYVVFAFSLGGDADRIYQRLATLLPDRPALIADLEAPSSPARSLESDVPAPSARTRRLRTALAQEIAAGQLEIITTNAGDVIRISGPLAFNHAGDTLTNPGHDLAERLVPLLDTEPGRILVVGHTDDGFVPSLRFASSVALTEAQARALGRVLVAHLREPERVDIEGRADTEPLLPNTSPANRDRNRRIEIVLAPAEARR